MKLIKIYTGASLEREDYPVHPFLASQEAYDKLCTFNNDESEEMVAYTNQCDAAALLYYAGIEMGIDVHVFVDGKKSNLNKAFEKWNKAIDFLNVILNELEKDGRR